jgi:alkylation response protein AidB-like acyl-CoA dehydrogenase
VGDLLAAAPGAIVAGSGLTSGTSAPAPGGWTVGGRWRFVSGVPCADHVILGTLVEDEDGGSGTAASATTGPSGAGPGYGVNGRRARRACYVLVPVADVEILDTWQVSGLRGTGSHDVVLRDVFVPDERAGTITSPTQTVPDAPFYRLPPGLRFPFPKVGVACGIARAAVDDFVELATAKTPTTSRSSLRERGDAQRAVGEATAALASGRAWVREVLDELWDSAVGGRPVGQDLHARARLACSNAVAGAVRAVELVCTAAGSTVNFLDSPLERRARDVRTVPQHFTVAPFQVTTAGRVLLGLDADDPTF